MTILIVSSTMHQCASIIIFAFSIFILKVNGQARFFPDHSIENLKTELIEALDTLKNMPMETLTWKQFFLWIEEAKRPANEAMRKHMCQSRFLPGNGEWNGCDLAEKWLEEMKRVEAAGHKKLEEGKAKLLNSQKRTHISEISWTPGQHLCQPALPGGLSPRPGVSSLVQTH